MSSPSLHSLPDLSDILGCSIETISPCHGGDSSEAYRATLADGQSVFVKKALRGTPFQMEALGLQQMADSPSSLRFPEVKFVDTTWLILEWIERGAPAPDYQSKLGKGLAQLHRKTHSHYGFEANHAIGMSPQQNQPWRPRGENAWRDFWWDYRLEPIFRALNHREIQEQSLRLQNQLDYWIPSNPDSGASLLHGDLWSGNVFPDEQGNPVLIDPAPYFGYREAELGITGMFGGFTDEFYEAYTQEWPLPDGWRKRQDFYMLYHVLNHAVLFQGSYVSQAQHLLHELLRTT